ncbi:MAG: hypothetical protein GY873_40425 [Bosea sp.]|uniref:hypothetical protein n=1 Tax=Bosea sp. (in: a-proteobacteria) TaxID=1871050 RepID=UPI00239BA6AD|nr:hypothetical protein [Bosea sp. (in: a-proteobacteria)]MCP4740469.1 hypothetical protein [Bosea sp. (in: a-proteobacteria)]
MTETSSNPAKASPNPPETPLTPPETSATPAEASPNSAGIPPIPAKTSQPPSETYLGLIKKLPLAAMLSVLGLLLFAICSFFVVYGADSDLSQKVTEETCKKHFNGKLPQTPPNGAENGVLRIVGVWPERVELGGSLCVAAAGIASQDGAAALNNTLQGKRAEALVRAANFERAQNAVRPKLDESQDLDKQIEEAVAAGRPVDDLRKKQAELSRQLEGLVKKASTEEQKYRQILSEQEAARAAVEKGPDVVKTVLFFGGKRANDLAFNALARPDIQYLVFRLQPATDAASETGKFWRDVLGGSTDAVAGQSWYDRYRVLDVGLSRRENSSGPEPSQEPHSISVLIYRSWLVGLGATAALCLMVAFALQARSTTLLRDHDAKGADGGPTAPYSLARSQMAMWGALVFFGFIYIWLVLGHINGILNSELLLLLGITAATGLIAVPITNAQNAEARAQGEPTKTTGSFWKDILQSGSAPQIHRIQMVAWSLLLAVIFTWNVITSFSFIKFDTTLLIMMGFVGGTYLGFKPTEK